MTRRDFLKLTTISVVAAAICEKTVIANKSTELLASTSQHNKYTNFIMHSARGNGKTLLSKFLEEQLRLRKEGKKTMLEAIAKGDYDMATKARLVQARAFNNINGQYGAYGSTS